MRAERFTNTSKLEANGLHFNVGRATVLIVSVISDVPSSFIQFLDLCFWNVRPSRTFLLCEVHLLPFSTLSSPMGQTGLLGKNFKIRSAQSEVKLALSVAVFLFLCVHQLLIIVHVSSVYVV